MGTVKERQAAGTYALLFTGRLHWEIVFPFIEFLPAGVSESPLRRELIEEEVAFEDGFIAPPSRPGLGIEINSAAMARFAETAEGYLMARADISR
ncbi:MAG: hypothetical protein DMG05_07015 [Acidobacteria bacterium]|nr:MAG: hypothetical protein DMG05_07015 [Acidobacteriota bacterium]